MNNYYFLLINYSPYLLNKIEILFQNKITALLNKQMESRIVYHIEKFIAFLFGEKNENDPEQRIYNKLLQLEGVELENFMHKVKGYINFVGFYSYYQGANFEGIVGPIRFEKWYIQHALKKSSELMWHNEIFNISEPEYAHELHAIKLKLYDFQESDRKIYGQSMDWKLHIMTDYMQMHIMTMSTEDLKSYIIQQVDPVEMR